jgi:hypothetical protein
VGSDRESIQRVICLVGNVSSLIPIKYFVERIFHISDILHVSRYKRMEDTMNEPRCSDLSIRSSHYGSVDSDDLNTNVMKFKRIREALTPTRIQSPINMDDEFLAEQAKSKLNMLSQRLSRPASSKKEDKVEVNVFRT